MTPLPALQQQLRARAPGQLPPQRLGRRTAERRIACEHLECNEAERVDVGAMIGVRGSGLLGRHVRGSANGHPRACECRPAHRLRHCSRDAEVCNHRVPVAEQDVVRLDVAMHDAFAMRVGQRIGDLAKQPGRFGHGQFALVVEPRTKRFALDQRHRVVERVRRPAPRRATGQCADAGVARPRESRAQTARR